MSLENLPGTDDQFAALRAALSGGDTARTPEIVAIFQQIKNLRESDRSLRSIRRNLELDNIPVLEEEAPPAEAEVPEPVSELATLLDSFLALKREKEELAARLRQVEATADALEAKVQTLNKQITSA